MANLRILSLFIILATFVTTSVFAQTRTEIANIGDDNQTTSFGPTFEGTISLLTIYHFETLFLANEIQLSADGELNAIEFYVTSGVDLDLLGSSSLYLKTTSQSSLSNGSISNPANEEYTQVEGSFSVLGLNLGGGDIVRFELDDGFPVDQGDNVALHTRQNIPVGASLGANYYASDADNLMRAGTTTLVGTPTMQVRDVRPNVRLEFETQSQASASNSVLRAGLPEIFANGMATTLVTLEVRSETGEVINSGGDSVQFSTSLGSISSANDNGDGTYTATLTSSETPGTATITATLNGQSVGSQATVEFVDSLSDLFCVGLTEETVRIGNLTSSVTPRGPLYTNTLSLTLGTYQFETLFLQNQFNVDSPGFLESIVFFTDNTIDVDALEGAQFYIRETSQTSLSEGNVSLDDYTFVGDGSSLVNISIGGNNAIRVEFETPFFYSGNGNIAFHSRHFALADVNLGGQFNFDSADEQLTVASGELIDLLGLGVVVGLTSPEFTNQRPVAELEFDLFTTASLSESILEADPDRIPADGASTSTITSFIRTANGMACELQGGNLPEFITTAGSLGDVSHEGDGEYSALLTSSTTAEFADVTANIDGLFLDEEAQVEFFLDPVPSPEFTTIDANPEQIAADGTSTSTITVTLRDENDEPITEGGFDITLSTTAGTLGSVTDNGDGTYTATLTSSANEETAIISGTLEGDDITDTAEVEFILDDQPPSPAFTTIEADPSTILADGESTSVITVTLRDDNNDAVQEGGFEVTLATTAGSLDDVTDNGDGTYTALLTSSLEEETAVITGTLEGEDIDDQAEVAFEIDQTPNADLSTVEANPRRILADGVSTSTITVTLRNSSGQQLTEGGDNVSLNTTAGSLGSVTDNNDGTYTATLTSSTNPEVAVVTATINGDDAGNDARVTFTDLIACPATELDFSLGDGSTTTSRGPLLNATASLAVSNYQFEAIYLQEEIGLTNSGEIRHIDFFVSSEINLSAVSDVSIFIKETSETTLPDGNVSLDDYSEITGSASLVNLTSSSPRVLRIELDEPFEYSNTANIAIHTRSNILLAASLGGNFLASDTGENRTRVSQPIIGLGDLVIGVSSPEATSTRPDVRFTIDVRDVPDPATSLISANPNSILADGASTSNITVELFNCFSEPIVQGGDDVVLSTTAGSLGSVTDNDDGTYNAVLTSSTQEETATINGEVNEEDMEDSANVQFTAEPIVPSPEFTTIEADPTSILADGTSTSTITVTLRDENDEPITTGGFDVTLAATAGTLGDITDNGDGTYTAILTSSDEEETAIITGTLEGEDIADDAQVSFVLEPVTPSPEFTIIEADPTAIEADGESQSTVTVTLFDENNERITDGGFCELIELETTDGTLSGITDNGDGTCTATLTSSTDPGTAVITGTLDGDEIEDDAEVEFTALPPSPEFTTITANPQAIDADGESTSTITVTLRNRLDEPVSTGGFDVELFTTAGTLGNITDNGDGTYVATLTSSTEEETAIITGTLEDEDIEDNAEVRFELDALPPSPEFTTIAANPTSIFADGESTSTITVTLRNENDETVGRGGFDVTLASTAGTLGDITDNGDGTYTAILTSSTEEETAIITGTVEGEDIADDAEVEFFLQQPSPDFTTITANPTTIAADGESTSTITVTLRDENDEPITRGGFDVTLSTTAGSLGSITDNGDGTYTAILTSSNQEETATITGTLEGEEINDTAQVNFETDPVTPSPEFTIITSDPDNIPADGESTSTITVTLFDENNDPITEGGFCGLIELSTTDGTLGSITDNGDGTCTATLTSSTDPGTAVITGTLDGDEIEDDAEVEFTVLPPTAQNTTINASPLRIIADGQSTSTITVRLRDKLNQRVRTGGFTVTLSTDAGSLSSVTDNGDGTYTAILTSSETPEIATITGTLEGDDIDDNAQVEFVEEILPPSPEFTTIEADPDRILADGASTSIVTVILRDENNELVGTGGFDVTISTTAGSLSSPSETDDSLLLDGVILSYAANDNGSNPLVDNGDGTYTAILTSSTIEETATITGTLEGEDIEDSAEVEFVIEMQPPSAQFTTIEADPVEIFADGESTSTITVTLRDSNDERVNMGGFDVELFTTAGTLSNVTDLGNGRYRAILTSTTTVETATITGTLEGETINDSAEVDFVVDPTALDPRFIQIVADPTEIPADGQSTSSITVILYDGANERITEGGFCQDIALQTTMGTLGSLVDNGDGTCSATLTSSQEPGDAIVSGTYQGDDIDDTATVTFLSLDMFSCSVEAAYPNPFIDRVTFRITTPDAGQIYLELFDVLGKRVATVVDHEINAGEHEFQFDGGHLSSGVYIYRLVCPCSCASDSGRITQVGRN